MIIRRIVSDIAFRRYSILNRNELKAILDDIGVPEYYYKIDLSSFGRTDERLCLERKDGKWIVYFEERGNRTTEEFFETEDEACRYILKRLE